MDFDAPSNSNTQMKFVCNPLEIVGRRPTTAAFELFRVKTVESPDNKFTHRYLSGNGKLLQRSDIFAG